MSAYVVRRPGEGVTLAGGRNAIKLQTGEANGSLAALENTVPPGRRIPNHVHGREEEAWYVLEGDLTFYIDGESVDAPTGTFVMVPRGTPHGFANNTDAPARVLEVFAPGGMERYFIERAAMAGESSGGELDYAGLDAVAHAELAARYHMRFVGDYSG